jgi:uncharacterized repeat protein (TIGR03943 family)
VSRETQNVLLLLVGLSTALMVVKGTYLDYVKPALLPWLIAAAVVLTALAVTAIVRDIKKGPSGPSGPSCPSGVATDDATEDGTGGAPEAGQGHPHRHWLVWLLLVPVALTAFVIPPPLGANGAAPQMTSASQPQRRSFPPLPAGQAPVVSLPEVLMRAASDSSSSLDGRMITVTGFTMKETGGTDLARVVIVCCAADAQLARIHLSGVPAAEALGYPADTWLQLEGSVVPGTSKASTDFIPTLAVASVQRIAKPANTYAY